MQSDYQACNGIQPVSDVESASKVGSTSAAASIGDGSDSAATQYATHYGARCIDCLTEGITTKRPIDPDSGPRSPRCATHRRAKQRADRAKAKQRHVAKTYGISEDQYQAIYKAQGGKCYICQRATGTGKKRLPVDHDHSTGAVRGLLCNPCNKNVLGHLRDSVEALQRAIDYLTNPPAVAAIGVQLVPQK